jgi:hypothetical protein
MRPLFCVPSMFRRLEGRVWAGGERSHAETAEAEARHSIGEARIFGSAHPDPSENGFVAEVFSRV